MKIVKYLSKIIIISIIIQLLAFPIYSYGKEGYTTPDPNYDTEYNGKSQNSKFTWDDIFGKGSDFIQQGKDQVNDNGKTGSDALSKSDMIDANSTIYNALFALGVVLTVIIGGVLGIQFMISSAEDKAKVKEALVPYIIGCSIIYGAFGIWKLVVLVLNQI